jgi:hypothetical protein
MYSRISLTFSCGEDRNILCDNATRIGLMPISDIMSSYTVLHQMNQRPLPSDFRVPLRRVLDETMRDALSFADEEAS